MAPPDVVKYDKQKMDKPVDDLILECNTMKEFGIVLDFQRKEITIHEIILPRRNINSIPPPDIQSLGCKQQYGQ